MNKKLAIVFFGLGWSLGCTSSIEVDTWSEWCAHENNRGIAEKQTGLIVAYNYRKIRDDFIKNYNEILVEEIVRNHFWDESIQDNWEAEQLAEKHLLGFG